MNENEDIETLDFEDESDIEVLNEIDAAFDIVFPKEKQKEEKVDILNGIKKEKLNVYTPSIKDFNIKSEKTRNVVKKVMLYTIIFILFTFEFFINKAGKTLNELKVYASGNEPIIILKNNKYGYIDYTGEIVVNPKYSYAENFVKGYAIVKDANNLPMIIDRGGKEVAHTGDYFSIYRAGSDLIVSKTTKKGLKYGILDPNLKVKTDFSYDTIMYINNVYTFIKNNNVGIINNDGKEIFTYKLNDSDDKIINVYPSKITDNLDYNYAVVTINHSSFIINIKDGTTISTPTVNELIAEDNNVFYEIKENKSKEYYYVYNNKITVDSIDYSNMQMKSVKAGVLKALTNNQNYEIINAKTGDIIDPKLSINDSYFGDSVFVYRNYSFKKNKIVYTLIHDGEVISNIEGVKGIKTPFKNGYAVVIYDDDKYGYVNEKGEFLNNEHYEYASSFDAYGDAICKKDDKYGVINKNNKVILDFKYFKIKKASEDYKKNTMLDDMTVFYAGYSDDYYTLYNKDGKKVNDTKYINVKFDDLYGIVKTSSDIKDEILISSTNDVIPITSFSSKYDAYENYVLIDNKYYNYKGKVIYINEKRGD